MTTALDPHAWRVGNNTSPPPVRNGHRPNETECQATIVHAAHTVGYRVLAIRPAQSRRGHWGSPIQGDAGFPDLVLAHPTAGVMFIELKRAPNKVEPDQLAWGLTLIRAGAVWRVVWVPEQLDAFCQELANRTVRQPI